MKAIRLQRFKAFEDSGWIEFKPITLLFGYNSAGKSSILQALFMLKQSIKNMADEVPFVFSSEKGIDLGAFEDVVHKHEIDHKQPMVISLRVDIARKALQVLYNGNSMFMREEPQNYLKTDIDSDSEEKSTIEFSIEISYNQKRRFIAVKGFTLTDMMSGKTILAMKKKGVSENEKPEYFSDYLNCKNKKVPISWYNFIPIVKPEGEFERITAVTEQLRKTIDTRLDGMISVGPLRVLPERTMLFTGERPASVGMKGEDTFKLLFNDKHSAAPLHLEELLNEYLSKYHYRYDWNLLKTNLGQFVLKDTITGIPANIVDVGFGISQILPIAVQLYATGKNQILLLEQPEIHLHSKAQADIADLLIDALKLQRKTIIVETHSENLLLRLRRRVVEGLITPEDIGLYYVDQVNSVSKAYLMNVNVFGDIENMPDAFKEFFIDNYNEIMGLHKAKGEKLSEDITQG
ncbi:MAG: ATP-binding protein [Ruminiclostridium sp.]|nr:ATP-binding protein [Ruminiclostridium sp.]